MFNSHEFFKTRFSAHLKETNRYLRYVFNGHTAIALFFLVAALAFYYQQWLAALPDGFPAAFIIGAGLGLSASYSPIRTLLKEPDLVFLITAENKMNAYFRNAIIYSFVIQLYIVLFVSAVLGPMYFAAFPDRAGNVYLLTIAVVLVFKIWNLFANWWMLKIREPGIRRTDTAVRSVLNIAVFYFIVDGNMLLAGITTALFIFVFLYDFSLSRKQPGVVWDLLVEKDQSRMQTFYRFANMFADVPHIKNRIRRRGWLVSLVSNLPFAQKHTYDYLYRITFVRSGDYLGMYIRLMIVGGLAIYFIPNLWIKILFVILFLYLGCFQMMTLYQHHRTIMWLDLYPVELETRRKSLIKLLFQLTLVQTILFSLLFLVMQEYLGFVIALAGGILFNYLFINGYVKKKIV